MPLFANTFTFGIDTPELWVSIGVGVLLCLTAFFVCFRASTNATGERAASQDSAEPCEDTSVPEVRDDYDPFVMGSRFDNRRALRRKGSTVEVELCDLQAEELPWRGLVIDRSAAGLRLVSECPVELDTVINVRAKDDTRIRPWIEIVVVRCKSIANGWELGCEFVRTPTYNVLLAFG